MLPNVKKIRDLHKRFQEISSKCTLCNPELIEFILQLLTIIEGLEEEVKVLRDQLSTDSHNSHRPPSTDGVRKRFIKILRQSNGKKQGGQRGHKGETLLMAENPQEVIIHRVKQCKGCQEDLQEIPPLKIKRVSGL